MVGAEPLTALVGRALMLGLVLSLPALAGGLAGALVARALHRWGGVAQEGVLPVLRFAGVAVGLGLAAFWIGDEVLRFARSVMAIVAGGGGSNP
jgi:type III secretory pathway component EscS